MYKAKNVLFKRDNFEVDYLTFGLGQQPLVLISGLSLSRLRGKAWQMSFMYRLFAKDYKVYMFDRRNHIPRGYQVSDMADDLALVMTELGVKNADVVGISQGGMIAQSLTIKHPELVSRLVLGVTLSRQNTLVQSTIGGWIALAQKRDREKLIKDMFAKTYSENYVQKHRWLIALLAKCLKPKEIERFLILAQACLTFDVYEELGAINCPTLVIGAAKDLVVSGQASLELANKLGCPFYLYENLGHSAYSEAKDFNQRVFDFLQGNGG
ncbi:alpha/beta fold hydrolase [Streptococcus downei]|uniref:Putative hydrolase n=1 Tax=Streptococcus downei MFe28 TaxID=764290 RepID=A0A380JHK2_STRDO|nr:alpha/beta hydrolase [Streptococcus downei]SUN36598.1 putative hydrolase [Streptococcus downei MFe28]